MLLMSNSTEFSPHLKWSGRTMPSDLFVCLPWPRSNCHCAKACSASIFVFSHIFSVSLRTLIDCHSTDGWREAPTIWALDPLIMTGRICLKSPPKTTVRPPNGSSELQISQKVQSTASWLWWCCIGALSQITKSVAQISLAKSVFLTIVQNELSWILIGILKDKCAGA